MEVPEAEFSWIARERDGESAMAARNLGSGGMEGPIDHEECKDFVEGELSVPSFSFFFSWGIGHLSSLPR